METAPRNQESERDLATGLAYRFVSAGYRYPDATGFDGLRELGAGLPSCVALLDGPPELGGLVEVLLERLRACSVADLEEEYVGLFGHSVHGPCPPYETEYGGDNERLQQPHEMADLNAFYRTFGLELADGVAERPDYLPLELEFAAFLCLKHSFALDHGDRELAQLASEARERFLRERLGRWAPAFGAMLLNEARTGFYPELTRVALALIELDCARLGAVPRAERLSLRAPAEPPDAFTQCAMSAERGSFEV